MKTSLLLLALALSTVSCQAESPLQNQDHMQAQSDILSAVNKADHAAVKNALSKGADVNTKDESGRSLLLIATNNKQVELAKILVQNGADVNLQAHNQDSPFLYAGASGQTELVRLYLAHGARFDIFNRYNGTALIPACERGHVETVRLLASTKGFPIDHVNRLGWTALMEAVILGDGTERFQQIVQLLKDAGATLDIPDHDNRTPLQHAEAKGFHKIAQLLK